MHTLKKTRKKKHNSKGSIILPLSEPGLNFMDWMQEEVEGVLFSYIWGLNTDNYAFDYHTLGMCEKSSCKRPLTAVDLLPSQHKK